MRSAILPDGLSQETCRPSRVGSPKLAFVEVGPSKGRIVRNSGLDPIVRARDRPAIPEDRVADGSGDRGFIGPEKDVSNLLVEQENEIKPARGGRSLPRLTCSQAAIVASPFTYIRHFSCSETG